MTRQHDDEVPQQQHTREPEERIGGMTCLTCRQRNAFELREIEHPVWVGPQVVLVRVQAGICRTCGRAIFDPAASAILSAARGRLEKGDVGAWHAVGTVYRASVPSSSSSQP